MLYPISIMKILAAFVQPCAWLLLASLALALAPLHLSAGTADPAKAGETLLPLRTGSANAFSYGLYILKSHAPGSSNAPAGTTLVLVLRNVAAKWVNFPDITADDFTLKDSRGRNIKLSLQSPPQPIGYGEATVLQIFVPKLAEAGTPWTLRFKSNSNAKVPFDISIPAVRL
jgi:hypothetical protein